MPREGAGHWGGGGKGVPGCLLRRTGFSRAGRVHAPRSEIERRLFTWTQFRPRPILYSHGAVFVPHAGENVMHFPRFLSAPTRMLGAPHSKSLLNVHAETLHAPTPASTPAPLWRGDTKKVSQAGRLASPIVIAMAWHAIFVL